MGYPLNASIRENTDIRVQKVKAPGENAILSRWSSQRSSSRDSKSTAVLSIAAGAGRKGERLKGARGSGRWPRGLFSSGKSARTAAASRAGKPAAVFPLRRPGKITKCRYLTAHVNSAIFIPSRQPLGRSAPRGKFRRLRPANRRGRDASRRESCDSSGTTSIRPMWP